MTQPTVILNERDRVQFNQDNDQAHYTGRHAPIILPFDPITLQVIRGPHAGHDVFESAHQIIQEYKAAGCIGLYRVTYLYPWWRLWQRTRAVRIDVSRPPLLDFLWPDRRQD